MTAVNRESDYLRARTRSTPTEPAGRERGFYVPGRRQSALAALPSVGTSWAHFCAQTRDLP